MYHPGQRVQHPSTETHAPLADFPPNLGPFFLVRILLRNGSDHARPEDGASDPHLSAGRA